MVSATVPSGYAERHPGRSGRGVTYTAGRMGQHGGVAPSSSVRRRLPPPRVWSPAFNRFTLATVLSGVADALVAMSLAGSLFFSLSPEASRQQVLLYLLINMAPFALLAPLVGPVIDRFRPGHRWIAVILFAVRAGAPPRWRSRCSTWRCTSSRSHC